MLACRLLGHRYRFWADAQTLRWRCQRGCEAGGEKQYSTSAEALRYADAFDREDARDLGRRAPLMGLFPLRLLYRLRASDRTPPPSPDASDRRIPPDV